MSPGVLGCSELCPLGVRTKFGINMVTSQEREPLRRGEPAQVGKEAGQNSCADQNGQLKESLGLEKLTNGSEVQQD